MSAAGDLKSNQPPDTGVRMGQVALASDGSVTVTVNGVVVNCGFINPNAYADGAPVLLLRYKKSWVAMGTVTDAAAPTYIAEAAELTDSASITTTETVIATVTGALKTGRLYHVWITTHVGSDSAANGASIRIREDALAGTVLNQTDGELTVNVGGVGTPWTFLGRYTAVADGSKTFVGTLQRVAGAGNLRREASANRPTIMWIEYVSG
jgi:hypothetical protein